MPTASMMAAPGRHMPRTPATAPIQPLSRSPSSTAMLVALRPGRLWLIESSSTNSLSSTQWFFVTRFSRRYGTTPPKLVAPMMRNWRKTSKTVTFARASATNAFSSTGRLFASLMALRCVSFQSVHHCGFRYTQREPVFYLVLQRKVELRRQLFGFVGHQFAERELHLERELAHQLLMLATGAPQADIALAHHALAEVELAQWQQHFLDDALIDQRDFFVTVFLDRRQPGEHSGQCRHRQPVGGMHLAEAELAIVRVQDAVAAHSVFQRQRFGLELDAVLAGDVGPHIERRRLLLVGMPELEDNLRVANREAIDVDYPPSQDEGIVVKAKVRSVAKGDFADFRTALRIRIRQESDPVLLGNLLRYLAEIAERFHRGERLRLEDQLGFQVVDSVERGTVGVGGVTRQEGNRRRWGRCLLL